MVEALLHNDSLYSQVKCDVSEMVYLVSSTLLCPLILLGNLLVIVPFVQSIRVRSPSNHLILYLAIVDLAFGAIMPLPLVLMRGKTLRCIQLGISIASFSFMVSIALDKAFSLAKPLHYSTLVTRINIQLYSLSITLLSIGGSVSLTLFVPSESQKDFQILLLGVLLIPCVILTSLAYFYIYTVASRHIRTIRQMEVSVRSKERRDLLVLRKSMNSCYMSSFEPHTTTAATSQERKWRTLKAKMPPTSTYGVNLSLTIALLLGSRLPGPVGFLLLGSHYSAYLILLDIPLYICSAFNPWIYAYHNLELKKVMRRLLRRLKKRVCLCKRANKSPPLSLHSSKTSKKPGGRCLFTTIILEESFISNSQTSFHPTVGGSELGLPQPVLQQKKTGILINLASLYALDPKRNLELSL